MMTNLMTILERKAFISSNPRIVLSSCPPPCGHFSIQESATGGLSYKAKKKQTTLYNDLLLSIFRFLSPEESHSLYCCVVVSAAPSVVVPSAAVVSVAACVSAATVPGSVTASVEVLSVLVLPLTEIGRAHV